MSSITINLTDEHLSRLKEIAARFGLTPEELARVSIEELIAQPDEKFECAWNDRRRYTLLCNATLASLVTGEIAVVVSRYSGCAHAGAAQRRP